MDYFFTCEYLVEQNNHWLTAANLKNYKLPEGVEIISKDIDKRCIVRFPDTGLPHSGLVGFCKAAADVLDKKCLYLIPYKISYDSKGNRISGLKIRLLFTHIDIMNMMAMVQCKSPNTNQEEEKSRN